MEHLYSRCEALLPNAMRLWESIVNIDTGSGDAEGLRELGAILEARLADLGFAIARHPAAGPDGEYTIVATKEGMGTKRFLLMAHMDTVFPRGTVAERPFTVKGEWAHGPGVSDCKGGIVVILETLELIEPEDYRTLTVIFNCDEEITSPSSKAVIIEQAGRHDYVLSYEPSSVKDAVCVARKSNAKIRIRAHGKSSHAGSAPDKGVNALRELVWQVERMQDLSDPVKNTTVVFSRFHSGDRVNVVPAEAEAWADVRVAVGEELDRIENDLKRLTATTILPDSRVEAELIRGRPPFPDNEATRALAAKARAIYAEIGRELEFEHAGGVGDVNFAYGHGAECLCRLGPVAGAPNHSVDEKNLISSIVPRIYLSVRLIRELRG